MHNHEVFGQGKVPSSWKIKKISDIGDVTTGTTPSTSVSKYYGGEFLFVKPSDLDDSIYIYDTETKLTKLGFEQTRRLPHKTVLVTCIGSIGKMGIAAIDLATNQQINSIVPNAEIISEYLFYNLKLRELFLNSYANKSLLPIINKTDFGKIHVPIPPLVEQRGIVEVLGTVDECIRLTDAVIERAEELKRGLMQQLLTRGIGHTEYKGTPLAMIPETWEIVPLKKHIKIQSGNYFKYEEFVPEGIRVLKIDNVSYNEIIWDTITYLPREYLDSFSELSLNENDIIMALNRPITNEKLKLGIVKKEDTPSILYQRVGRLITKNHFVLNPKFLYYYMSTGYFMNELRRIFRGTDQPYVNPTEIVTLKMPIPSKIEQEKIIEIIENQDAMIDLEKQKQKQLNQVKQGLIQQLLSGKTRVELKGDGLHRIRDGRKANNRMA